MGGGAQAPVSLRSKADCFGREGHQVQHGRLGQVLRALHSLRLHKP